MKKKMFVTARPMGSYKEEYDPAYPYDFDIDPVEFNNEGYWSVATVEVEFEAPTREHVVACQIHGLEEAIAKEKANAFDRVTRLEAALQELLALPAPDTVPF